MNHFLPNFPYSNFSMKRNLRLAFILNFSFLIINSHAQSSFIKDSLETYIQQGIKDWQIPGLSIVIVKDGKVVLMKGYGVKDITKDEPVDENTLFMIASNTKLFTGTALAQLDFNKKLSLDDKITKHIEGYKLYDATTTELVTIRDLLSHRIGTKTFQGDFTFFDGNLSRREIMFGMRFLKPSGKFRQDYGYCNSCYLTAGQTIPVVSGKPWEVYVYDSIIAPLNMKNTHVLSAGIGQMGNTAKAYTTSFTGKLNEVPYDTWDNLAPAASIISNVNDLSHWLLMQLDSGKYNNKRIMPWPVLQKTRDVNIITSSRKSGIYPIHFRGYGLGIFAADYNGKQMYWHTGGASGMVSNVCFVPEENLGIAILTNNDNQSFFELLRYQILDAYLGVKYVNRSQQQLPAFNKGEAEALKEIENLKARLKGNKSPLALPVYEGEYTNELYGKIIITAKDKQLNIKFKSHNNLTATLDYLDNDEWLLQYNNILYGIFPIKFKTENGKVKSIDIKANDFIEYDPYTFIKK
jgi:CubicO group peptidase (beta-lactamase class C family)